jgi:xylulose-5-phosphate/fructose-6-phosphate phosphoketolase
MKTPKGWTCPKTLPDGTALEGTYRSHQIPLKNVTTDKREFKLLQEWLSSYNVLEFFNADGSLRAEMFEIIFPEDKSKRMGQNGLTYPECEPLKTPSEEELAVKQGEMSSAMTECGKFLSQVIERLEKPLLYLEESCLAQQMWVA